MRFRTFLVLALCALCSGCPVYPGSHPERLTFSASPRTPGQPAIGSAAAAHRVADLLIARGIKKTEFGEFGAGGTYSFHPVHDEVPGRYRVVDEYLDVSGTSGDAVTISILRIDDMPVRFKADEVERYRTAIGGYLQDAIGYPYAVNLLSNTAP